MSMYRVGQYVDLSFEDGVMLEGTVVQIKQPSYCICIDSKGDQLGDHVWVDSAGIIPPPYWPWQEVSIKPTEN